MKKNDFELFAEQRVISYAVSKHPKCPNCNSTFYEKDGYMMIPYNFNIETLCVYCVECGAIVYDIQTELRIKNIKERK